MTAILILPGTEYKVRRVWFTGEKCGVYNSGHLIGKKPPCDFCSTPNDPKKG